MKKAVMYGGGNIGRGFIGQLMFQAGYAVSFVDVNQELLTALNTKKEYPVRILKGESYDENRSLTPGNLRQRGWQSAPLAGLVSGFNKIKKGDLYDVCENRTKNFEPAARYGNAVGYDALWRRGSR